ncbi:hypothetical protein TrVE_jg9882 [Triparma verrucosa]|uniref:Bromo domain-containing protein n=1 Tax=Triparma verrucosa TaxID=1606542 RepID=A0A9W7DM15_9STRA|nr:hypothetical protein TrVE_jg9882 [Triparma verrucosa]
MEAPIPKKKRPNPESTGDLSAPIPKKSPSGLAAFGFSNKLAETRKQFPNGWLVEAKGKSGYKITSPPPTYTFTTIKDAKAYLTTGVPPVKKPRKKKGDPSPDSTSTSTSTSASASSPTSAEDKASDKAELVKKQFPEGWKVTVSGKSQYLITSPTNHTFNSISDAKAFLSTGALPSPSSSSSSSSPKLVISPDLRAGKTLADIYADPLSMTACLTAYQANVKPTITPALLSGMEAMMKILCENHLSESFAEDLLHAEGDVADTYRQDIVFPVNLQEICRNIHDKKYKKTTELKIQVYRVFANSLKLQNSLGSPPSFRAISNHLRAYFNTLYMEFVMPSETPALVKQSRPAAYEKNLATQLHFTRRDISRKIRLTTIAETNMSQIAAQDLAKRIKAMAANGAKVDDLDTPLPPFLSTEKQSLEALATQIENITKLPDQEKPKIKTIVQWIDSVKAQHRSLTDRLSRALGMLSATVYEFVTRGIDNCSCIWAIPMKSIWARQNMKEPYLPATIIGEIRPGAAALDPIKAELCRINEARFPQDIIETLRKREATCKKLAVEKNECFYLVEFLGTHEFGWVRAKDTITPFSSEENPNWSVGEGGAKERISAGVLLQDENFTLGKQQAEDTLEELKYRMEDPCGDALEDELDAEGKPIAPPAQEPLKYSEWIKYDKDTDDGLVSDQDGELLLATHGDPEMYEKATSSGFVTAVGKPVVRKLPPTVPKRSTSDGSSSFLTASGFSSLSAAPNKQETVKLEKEEKERILQREFENEKRDGVSSVNGMLDVLDKGGIVLAQAQFASASAKRSGLVGLTAILKGSAGIISGGGENLWDMDLKRIPSAKKREEVLELQIKLIKDEIKLLQEVTEARAMVGRGPAVGAGPLTPSGTKRKIED